MSWKSGNLNLLESSGPHRAHYGTLLPLPLYIYICGTLRSVCMYVCVYVYIYTYTHTHLSVPHTLRSNINGLLHNLIKAGCHEHRSTCGSVLRSHCCKLFTSSNGRGMTVQRNNVWYSSGGVRSNLRDQHCVTVKIRPIRLTHEATLWSVSQFITDRLALLPHSTSQPWPVLTSTEFRIRIRG